MRRARQARLRPQDQTGSVSEHQLQVAVLDHLKIYGRKNLNWFAIPNAGKRSFHYAARMKAEGMQAGVADICVMLEAGRCAWLELKTKRGWQTPEQRGFEEKCMALGHPYCLARSLDRALEFLISVGALRA